MLGDIASVATLILFVIYFIGRAVTIVRTNTIYNDEVSIMSPSEDRQRLQIVDEIELEPEGPFVNEYILTSGQGIYSLVAYKLVYNNQLEVVNQEKIYTCKFLNTGQSLLFRTSESEFVGFCRIEYRTFDYKKVVLELWSNGKNGVLSESARPRHTVRSVLYYLFR